MSDNLNKQREHVLAQALESSGNIDLKYGRVITEFGDFIDGEPVFVFRARDRELPNILYSYRRYCEADGAPAHHIEAIEESIQIIMNWQNDNPLEVRVPKSDNYARRVGK